MATVGAYLQELRNAQNLTLKAVADGLGVSDRIVSAWEKGEHAPKIDVMPGLLKKLRGAWEDVSRLMAEELSEAEARDIAKRRLAWGGLTDEQKAFLEQLTPDQRDALLTFARQMQRN